MNRKKKVVMVDIDKELVDFCRKHLSEWSQGAFEDPRVELHYEDAREYLLNCKKDKQQTFDVVIMDICDPTKGSETVKLYEKEFYEQLVLNGTLNPGFVFVLQSGPCSQATIKKYLVRFISSTSFSSVSSFSLFYLFIFFDCWGFNIGFEKFLLTDPLNQLNQKSCVDQTQNIRV